MKIAIASGKGGTGKTTIAANLAEYLSKEYDNIYYFDCDVEEPNGRFFLKPEFDENIPVYSLNPVVDKSVCTGCGICGKICQFNAIICLNKNVMTFPDLCHSCGGCQLACPVNAISKKKNEIGVIQKGKAKKITFFQGLLKIGKAMSPPLIRKLKKEIPPHSLTIIDCPPGTSCPAVESVRDSDFVVLVTEPTPFGLNDLKLSVDTLRELKLPMGVVINRCDLGDSETTIYCKEQKIPILGEIPNDREIAVSYSKGNLFTMELPRYNTVFEKIYEKIISLAPTEKSYGKQVKEPS